MAAAVSAFLFVVFLIGISEAAARGLTLECGCFGGGGQTAGSTHYTLDILRDIGLLAVAVFLVLWPLTRISIDDYAARHDYVEPPSAKRLRQEGALKKYNAMVEAKRRQARDRNLYVNGALAIVIILVTVIGIGVQSGRAKIKGQLSATNATVANGIVYGTKAAATVDIYEDFQCPHCLDFETAVASTLDADVVANRAQVRFHPMSFLDSATGSNKYSSRAANAAICASDASVDLFVKFHNMLFTSAIQPAEGSSGRPDSTFVDVGQKVGMTPDQVTTLTTCMQTHQHRALVQAITEAASKKGINSTPTVLVNGKKVDATLAALNKAIADAAAKGPAPTPSPSGSSTPSASSSGSSSTSPSPSASATK
jgi:protein-disulfide isomerase